MADFLSIIAAGYSAQANLFALQQQQQPLLTLAQETLILKSSVDSVSQEELAIYAQNARMISFDQKLGQLLGITV